MRSIEPSILSEKHDGPRDSKLLVEIQKESSVKSPTKKIKPIGLRSSREKTTRQPHVVEINSRGRSARPQGENQLDTLDVRRPEHSRKRSTRVPRALVSRSGVERDEHGGAVSSGNFQLISVEFYKACDLCEASCEQAK